MTKAWLSTLKGEAPDSRLATTDDAYNVALWTDSVIRSHEELKNISVALKI